jgi:hypothetical protein
VPRDGLERSQRSRGRGETADGLLTLLVTGPRGADDRGSRGGVRVIAVGAALPTEQVTRPWLKISPGQIDRLGEIWRRACHA